ncbi:MAG: catalase-related domain-containing protein [Bacillota bacterium]
MISNLTDALKVCSPQIQQKMIEHFTIADKDYGIRLAESLEKSS